MDSVSAREGTCLWCSLCLVSVLCYDRLSRMWMPSCKLYIKDPNFKKKNADLTKSV